MLSSKTLSKRNVGSDAAADVSFYEISETVYQFENIKKWLLQNNTKGLMDVDQINGKTLSQLIIQLIQFQHRHFGIFAAQQKQLEFTRIPVECFMDFRADGALCRMLAILLEFKYTQGWKRIDLTSQSRFEKHIELFKRIINNLEENNCLIYPTCFLRPEIDPITRDRLQAIIKRHNGLLADSEDDADHVVYPAAMDNNELKRGVQPCKEDGEDANFTAIPDSENNGDDSQSSGPWARSVQQKNNRTLVHFWFKPDSYDKWINNGIASCLGEAILSDNCTGLWQVSANWILDTELYNEWMNEEDYEIDEDQFSDGDTRCNYKVSSEKRPILISDNDFTHACSPAIVDEEMAYIGSDRRLACRISMSANSEFDRLEADGRDESEKPTLNSNTSNWADIENHQTNQSNGAVTKTSKVDDGECDAWDDSNVDKTLVNLSIDGSICRDAAQRIANEKQSHHVVIPSYSAWFQYDSIHSIERRSLIEFFGGTGSDGQLTNMNGDHYDRLTGEHGNKSKTPEVYLSYRNFMIDTYRSCPSEYLTVTACRRSLAGDACSVMRVHSFLEQWGLINYQVEAESKPYPIGPLCSSHFSVMADTPSGLGNVHYLKKVDSTLNQEDDSFLLKEISDKGCDEHNDSSHVTLMEERKNRAKLLNSQTRDWTSEETLLLLEGLEMYKDDWNKIADYVHTKTQDECILKFLQLPIEDPYVENCKDLKNDVPLNFDLRPFTLNGNPIMSTVALLASVVDPRVASAACKAALSEFESLRGEQQVSDSKLKNEIIDESEETNDADGIESTSAHADQVINNDEMEVEEKQENNPSDNITSNLSDAKHASDVKQEGEDADTSTSTANFTVKKSVPMENKNSSTATDKTLKIAASSALAAASVRSKVLEEYEQQMLEELTDSLVHAQTNKLELKLKQLDEIELLLEKEFDSLEEARAQLLNERQQFQIEQIRAAELKQRALAAQKLIMNDSRVSPPSLNIPPNSSAPTIVSATVTNLGNPSDTLGSSSLGGLVIVCNASNSTNGQQIYRSPPAHGTPSPAVAAMISHSSSTGTYPKLPTFSGGSSVIAPHSANAASSNIQIGCLSASGVAASASSNSACLIYEVTGSAAQTLVGQTSSTDHCVTSQSSAPQDVHMVANSSAISPVPHFAGTSQACQRVAQVQSSENTVVSLCGPYQNYMDVETVQDMNEGERNCSSSDQIIAAVGAATSGHSIAQQSRPSSNAFFLNETLALPASTGHNPSQSPVVNNYGGKAVHVMGNGNDNNLYGTVNQPAYTGTSSQRMPLQQSTTNQNLYNGQTPDSFVLLNEQNQQSPLVVIRHPNQIRNPPLFERYDESSSMINRMTSIAPHSNHNNQQTEQQPCSIEPTFYTVQQHQLPNVQFVRQQLRPASFQPPASSASINKDQQAMKPTNILSNSSLPSANIIQSSSTSQYST